MNRTALLSLFAVALATSLLYLAPSFAQQSPPDAPEQDAPPAADTRDDQDTNGDAQPSADDVLQELLQQRDENPLIDPSRPGSEDESTPRRDEQDSDDNRAAEAVAGIAPGAAEATLRREGQFVITRRGRMLRAPGDISGWVFVFEADSSGMREPPMYLMPCQLLEDMEEIVQEHGDSVVFTLSGQIYLYRGANYLLPTLMQLAPDRGNIEP